MPDTFNAIGVVVRQAQTEYLANNREPSPEELQHLLAHLLGVQTRAWDWYAGTGFVTSLDPATLMPQLVTNQREELRAALEKTDAQLSAMVDVLRFPPDAQAIWRDVTAPLIAGDCFGPPFCSAALVESQGGKVTQTPIIARPYMNLNQAARIKGEARAEWENFKADLEDRFEEVVGAGMGLGLLALGALFLFTRGGK